MNFKKRVNGSWVDSPHYIMGTSTDTITTLPAVIYANDTSVTVEITGNTGGVGDLVESGEHAGEYVIPVINNGVTTNIYNATALDISDSLTATIPTIAGANIIDVDATLKPSEVSVNYKGWHPAADVHEFTSNYTVGTMQSLTIAQLQTHTISELQGGEWS